MNWKKPLPTQARLKQFLSYNPETGILWWHTRKGAAAAGRVVDCHDPDTGYILVRFDDQLYMAHRIIYRIQTGIDPGEKEVDHINLIRDDNRWKNLRISSSSQNMHNMKILKRNKSGFKGVSWNKGCRKWQTYVTINYKQYRAGMYDTTEKAAAAIRKLRRSLHIDHTNHGGKIPSRYTGRQRNHNN